MSDVEYTADVVIAGSGAAALVGALTSKEQVLERRSSRSPTRSAFRALRPAGGGTRAADRIEVVGRRRT
jgi:aspartate oxidase